MWNNIGTADPKGGDQRGKKGRANNGEGNQALGPFFPLVPPPVLLLCERDHISLLGMKLVSANSIYHSLCSTRPECGGKRGKGKGSSGFSNGKSNVVLEWP